MFRRIMITLLAALPLLLIPALWWLYTPDQPRAALEVRYAAAPSQFLEVEGLRLHLRDTGPRGAPPVLFLHGFGASLHTWEEVAQGLAPDFRVLRIDLPGFGLTGPDPSGDYTDERAAVILLALMQRLGLERLALVGSSMGGRIAWRFAAAHPERVARLVLMAPDGFASPGIGYGGPPRVPLLMRALPYTLPDALLRPGLTPAYADPATLTEPLFQRYRAMMLAPVCDGRSWTAWPSMSSSRPGRCSRASPCRCCCSGASGIAWCRSPTRRITCVPCRMRGWCGCPASAMCRWRKHPMT